MKCIRKYTSLLRLSPSDLVERLNSHLEPKGVAVSAFLEASSRAWTLIAPAGA